jgi:eukaryotic-like serine/threonine-protein kinase
MGTVYKAQDRELGRLVALKVIRPEMAARPEILERFKREILLASQVTHKNVLRIHDLGEAGEIRFISMSYVEGSNLKILLEREGPLSLDKGLPLARQIGDALQAAHDAGIVHRDLKPQNILIDRDGMAYIADFGISRSLAEGGTMTETGAILGTVDYMSPEQARGETPDHRGDIFSFGVILYEMFTGGLPFRASNALSIMMKRLHEDAPSMRQARPELPAWLSAIVARAMQRDPNDRYSSAGELLHDLERQRASRSWRRFAAPRYLVPAAVLVLALLVAWNPFRLTWPPWGTSAAPPPRTSLVLLPFQNATGDPHYDWVRIGLPSLIRSELIEAKALRLVGEDRIKEVLASLKLGDDFDPTPTTTRRIASLLGAENVLGGKLVRIADRLRIDATLRPAGGSSSSGAALADEGALVVDGVGDEAVFAMVDDLTRRVRERLGVAGGLLERRRGATELSTKSVEALSLYGDGLALARSGNQLEAVKRLTAALDKDPQFHVARALLAETYDQLGYTDKATAEAARAVAGIGSTSPYEAARIRAVQARLTNNSPEALKAYRELCEIAPNNTEVFFDLAAAQEEAGDLAGALKSLQRVIALDSKHPSAFYALGRVHYKLGKGAESLKDFNTALALHTETGNEEGRAAVLNGLGNAYRYLMGQPDEALKNYRAALEIRRQIGDRRGVGVTLRNLASMQRELGRHDEAIKSIKEALAISQEMKDREGLSYGYSELGDVQQDAGRPEEALLAYQESLKVVRDIDDPVNVSRGLASVGYINSVLGRYVEAFIFLKEALAKRREIGERTEIVRSLIDIGLVEQLQGRYEEALKYETEGLTMAREIGDKVEISVLSANMSNIHEDQGEYGPALSLLNDAHRLAKEVNDKTLIMTCLVYLGSVRRHVGDTPGADGALEEALRLAREMKNAPFLAEALSTQAALLLEGGQRARALAVAKEAVEQARAAHDQRLILLARLHAAEASQSTRDLEQVAGAASNIGLAPLTAATRLALARVHLAAGRGRDAAREADLAQQIASSIHLRDVQFEALHLAGKTLRMQGQTAAARDRAGQALGLLGEMRQGLSGTDLSMFLGRPLTVDFGREAEALFKGPDHAQEALRLRSLLKP